MVKAIRIRENGGPEVMKWEDYKVPLPGEGEVLIEHSAIGLNFIDVYHRTGLYPLPGLPWVLGMEGAGTVSDVGEGSQLEVGEDGSPERYQWIGEGSSTSGKLIHQGWQATKVELPKYSGSERDANVIAPAQVQR